MLWFKPSTSQNSKASIKIGMSKMVFTVGYFICCRSGFSSKIAAKYRSPLIQENYLGYAIPPQASDIYPVRGSQQLRKILCQLPYIDTEDGSEPGQSQDSNDLIGRDWGLTGLTLINICIFSKLWWHCQGSFQPLKLKGGAEAELYYGMCVVFSCD